MRHRTFGTALLACLLLSGCMTYHPVTSIRMNAFTTLNTNAYGVVYLEECVADAAGNPILVRYIVDYRTSPR